MMLRKWTTQKGELATTLTLIGVGLMVVGTIFGSWFFKRPTSVKIGAGTAIREDNFVKMEIPTDITVTACPGTGTDWQCTCGYVEGQCQFKNIYIKGKFTNKHSSWRFYVSTPAESFDTQIKDVDTPLSSHLNPGETRTIHIIFWMKSTWDGRRQCATLIPGWVEKGVSKVFLPVDVCVQGPTPTPTATPPITATPTVTPGGPTATPTVTPVVTPTICPVPQMPAALTAVCEIIANAPKLTCSWSGDGPQITYDYEVFNALGQSMTSGSTDSTTISTYQGIESNKSYTCKVSASNQCGSSDQATSNEVTCPPGVPCPKPEKPTITAPPVTIQAGIHSISWTAVDNIGLDDVYHLRIDNLTDSPEWSDNCGSLLAGDRCYNDLKSRDYCNVGTGTCEFLPDNFTFEAGKSYEIWVAAVNSCGWGADSTHVVVTVSGVAPTSTPVPTAGPTCPALEMPTDLDASCEKINNRLTLTCEWDPVSGTGINYDYEVVDSSSLETVTSGTTTNTEISTPQGIESEKSYQCHVAARLNQCTSAIAVSDPATCPLDACPKPGKPTIHSPPASIEPGPDPISWAPVANIGPDNVYHLRIDNLTDSPLWSDDCDNPLAGDRCFNNLKSKDYCTSTECTYEGFVFEADKSYEIWVAAENICGWGADSTHVVVTVSGVAPTATPTVTPGGPIPSPTGPRLDIGCQVSLYAVRDESDGTYIRVSAGPIGQDATWGELGVVRNPESADWNYTHFPNGPASKYAWPYCSKQDTRYPCPFSFQSGPFTIPGTYRISCNAGNGLDREEGNHTYKCTSNKLAPAGWHVCGNTVDFPVVGLPPTSTPIPTATTVPGEPTATPGVECIHYNCTNPAGTAFCSNSNTCPTGTREVLGISPDGGSWCDSTACSPNRGKCCEPIPAVSPCTTPNECISGTSCPPDRPGATGACSAGQVCCGQKNCALRGESCETLSCCDEDKDECKTVSGQKICVAKTKGGPTCAEYKDHDECADNCPSGYSCLTKSGESEARYCCPPGVTPEAARAVAAAKADLTGPVLDEPDGAIDIRDWTYALDHYGETLDTPQGLVVINAVTISTILTVLTSP